MQPGSGIIFKYGQICWKREVHIFRKREERKNEGGFGTKKRPGSWLRSFSRRHAALSYQEGAILPVRLILLNIGKNSVCHL